MCYEGEKVLCTEDDICELQVYERKQSESVDVEVLSINVAQEHARCGWRVFPAIYESRDWVERATTDPEQIYRWWTQWPNARVGIITTAVSPLVIMTEMKSLVFERLSI